MATMANTPETIDDQPYQTSLQEAHREAEARGNETIAAVNAAHREAEARSQESWAAIEAAAAAHTGERREG